MPQHELLISRLVDTGSSAFANDDIRICDAGIMTLPLSGLLVVSVEQAVAAPQCTCRLADAGARVIKVERPEGDFARGYDHVVHGESANFVWLNRGKESIVLDRS